MVVSIGWLFWLVGCFSWMVVLDGGYFGLVGLMMVGSGWLPITLQEAAEESGHILGL